MVSDENSNLKNDLQEEIFADVEKSLEILDEVISVFFNDSEKLNIENNYSQYFKNTFNKLENSEYIIQKSEISEHKKGEENASTGMEFKKDMFKNGDTSNYQTELFKSCQEDENKIVEIKKLNENENYEKVKENEKSSSFYNTKIFNKNEPAITVGLIQSNETDAQNEKEKGNIKLEELTEMKNRKKKEKEKYFNENTLIITNPLRNNNEIVLVENKLIIENKKMNMENEKEKFIKPRSLQMYQDEKHNLIKVGSESDCENVLPENKLTIAKNQNFDIKAVEKVHFKMILNNKSKFKIGTEKANTSSNENEHKPIYCDRKSIKYTNMSNEEDTEGTGIDEKSEQVIKCVKNKLRAKKEGTLISNKNLEDLDKNHKLKKGDEKTQIKKTKESAKLGLNEKSHKSKTKCFRSQSVKIAVRQNNNIEDTGEDEEIIKEEQKKTSFQKRCIRKFSCKLESNQNASGNYMSKEESKEKKTVDISKKQLNKNDNEQIINQTKFNFRTSILERIYKKNPIEKKCCRTKSMNVINDGSRVVKNIKMVIPKKSSIKIENFLKNGNCLNEIENPQNVNPQLHFSEEITEIIVAYDTIKIDPLLISRVLKKFSKNELNYHRYTNHPKEEDANTCIVKEKRPKWEKNLLTMTEKVDTVALKKNILASNCKDVDEDYNLKEISEIINVTEYEEINLNKEEKLSLEKDNEKVRFNVSKKQMFFIDEMKSRISKKENNKSEFINCNKYFFTNNDENENYTIIEMSRQFQDNNIVSIVKNEYTKELEKEQAKIYQQLKERQILKAQYNESARQRNITRIPEKKKYKDENQHLKSVKKNKNHEEMETKIEKKGSNNISIMSNLRRFQSLHENCKYDKKQFIDFNNTDHDFDTINKWNENKKDKSHIKRKLSKKSLKIKNDKCEEKGKNILPEEFQERKLLSFERSKTLEEERKIWKREYEIIDNEKEKTRLFYENMDILQLESKEKTPEQKEYRTLEQVDKIENKKKDYVLLTKPTTIGTKIITETFETFEMEYTESLNPIKEIENKDFSITSIESKTEDNIYKIDNENNSNKNNKKNNANVIKRREVNKLNETNIINVEMDDEEVSNYTFKKDEEEESLKKKEAEKNKLLQKKEGAPKSSFRCCATSVKEDLTIHNVSLAKEEDANSLDNATELGSTENQAYLDLSDDFQIDIEDSASKKTENILDEKVDTDDMKFRKKKKLPKPNYDYYNESLLQIPTEKDNENVHDSTVLDKSLNSGKENVFSQDLTDQDFPIHSADVDNPKYWPTYVYKIKQENSSRLIVACVLKAKVGGIGKQSHLECLPISTDKSLPHIDLVEDAASIAFELKPTLTDFKFNFSTPWKILIPHVLPKNIQKELVILVLSDDNNSWKELETTEFASDELKEYKMRFVEAIIEVPFGTFVVQTKSKIDTGVINKHGARVTSSVDSRVFVSVPSDALRITLNTTLKINPIDHNFWKELKTKSEKTVLDHVICSSHLINFNCKKKKLIKPANFSCFLPLNPEIKKQLEAQAKVVPLKKTFTSESDDDTSVDKPVRTDTKIEFNPFQKLLLMNGITGANANENIQVVCNSIEEDKWFPLENVQLSTDKSKEQISMELPILQTLRCFMVRANRNITVENLAKSMRMIENELSIRNSSIVLMKSIENPREFVLIICLRNRLERCTNQYIEDGYQIEPQNAPVFLELFERQTITAQFTGNVTNQKIDRNVLKFTHQSLFQISYKFRVKELDSYAQRAIDHYRGYLKIFIRKLVKRPIETVDQKTRKGPIHYHMVEEDVLTCQLLLSIPKRKLVNYKAFRDTIFNRNILDEYISLFALIAEGIRSSWKDLGTSLRISDSRMQSIRHHNNPHQFERMLVQMLIFWLKGLEIMDNKADILMNALLYINRVDLVSLIKRKIEEEEASLSDSMA